MPYMVYHIGQLTCHYLSLRKAGLKLPRGLSWEYSASLIRASSEWPQPQFVDVCVRVVSVVLCVYVCVCMYDAPVRLW